MKKPDLLPDAPGVYLMKDRNDAIIYIGKASSLKKRVSQYFQRTDQGPKTRALVRQIHDLEYMVTPTEIDALILESNLIKEHRPRYNVDLKDDKQYPYIKITVNEEYPRIFLTRRRLKDGARYFGPYTNAAAVRETIKLVSSIFGIRHCKKKITGRSRPCLNHQIGLCSAPCTNQTGKEAYRESVASTIHFLEGKSEMLVKNLKQRMQDYSSKQNFEAAAAVRDQLQAVETISRRQQVTAGFDDWDAVSIALSGDMACAHVMFIRNGSLVGHAGFTMNSKNAEAAEVMGAFLKQYYSQSPIPRAILVNILPDDPAIVQWLRKVASIGVEIILPSRGRKKELVEMASKNAQSLLEIALIKEERREKSAHAALIELQQVLDLENIPEHIEAFDISNISGTLPAGSMVVFIGGRADKKRYRHFNITTVAGIDDPAMIEEVLFRRMRRVANGEDERPDLLMVDGGPTQVGAARRALIRQGLDIPLLGLAKQFEHIYLPGRDIPLILPPSSPALILLRQMRDEAHRFAIAHHRRLRSSQLRESVLDTIPGIGKKRKELLLLHFGSLEGIKAASINELKDVPGISKVTAEAVFRKLHELSKSL